MKLIDTGLCQYLEFDGRTTKLTAAQYLVLANHGDEPTEKKLEWLRYYNSEQYWIDRAAELKALGVLNDGKRNGES